MNPYIETSTANCTRHNAVQGFAVISDNKCEPREYMETNMGPWGWQWRDGVGDLVSASPSPIRVTIKTLMDDIEKVGISEKTCASLFADEECLECTRNVQNDHGLGLLKIARMSFHRRRTIHGRSPQPSPQIRERKDVAPT